MQSVQQRLQEDQFIRTALLLPEGGAIQDSTGFPKNEGKERKEKQKDSSCEKHFVQHN